MSCTVMDPVRGIPAQFQRIPYWHESCAALCLSQNLNRVLVLFTTQRRWLLLCFKDPPSIFESRGLIGPPFHNFRSITATCDVLRWYKGASVIIYLKWSIKQRKTSTKMSLFFQGGGQLTLVPGSPAWLPET